MNILFICLENVCRSPVAEALLKKKFKENNIEGKVSSAGFESYMINEPVGDCVQEMGAKHELDLSESKARMFVVSDFDEYDKIYVMDTHNYRDVKDLARDIADLKKVDYLMNVVHPGRNMIVPNPFSDGKTDFDDVYEMLDKATDKIVEMVKNA
ncbi:MAG: low molecular weight phosphotyrosine protein phosphatase [Chlorobi bacterium]|nr:low molecular weight phosphotyrosine protein phosphatase [Chlorobiota bacterium]